VPDEPYLQIVVVASRTDGTKCLGSSGERGISSGVVTTCETAVAPQFPRAGGLQ
jgi:hypothetical protein